MLSKQPTEPTRIALTGGIGAGKSVVSRILKALGYPVYDCDTNARLIMDCRRDIQTEIAEKICREAICQCGIDRKMLGSEVFGNPQKLQMLNEIVHRHVIADFNQWCGLMASFGHTTLFVETAILFESGLDSHIHTIWDVTAPTEVRIKRVMQRNGLNRSEVIDRINSQSPGVLTHGSGESAAIHTIVNDNVAPLLPQVFALLKTI